MGIFDSKNERDNENYDSGYEVGRGSRGPVEFLADGLFRDLYGEEWNAGYEQGQADADKYGKKD